MKRVSPSSYRQDTLYPRVERAVRELLGAGQLVSAPAVFVRMGMLSETNLAAWRKGQVPYLERVIAGSLGKTSRVLRILGLHAHQLNLPPAPPHAAGNIKWKGRPLRFSKSGERGVEDAYKRVFAARGGHTRKANAQDEPARSGTSVSGGAVGQADAADEARRSWG